LESIADIRLAASLEFLDSIDYDLPAWARDHRAAMEAALADLQPGDLLVLGVESIEEALAFVQSHLN